MSNNSVIEHRANYYYIMVQEDYLAICSTGKRSPHCKAMILAILEHWTNTKRDKGEGEYVYLTVPQWIKYTYMLYERNIITDCIKELLAEGLIERRPIVMFYQKTFDYRLCTETIQNLIRSLPTKRKEDVFPNLDAYLTFKERGKKERTEKREKEGVGEKSRTSKRGKKEGEGVGDNSPTVREKSQGVGDNSPMVGDFSQEVREKSTQLILTKIPLTSTDIQESNVVSSGDENDHPHAFFSQEKEVSYPQPSNDPVDNSIQSDVETSLPDMPVAISEEITPAIEETESAMETAIPEEASEHPIAAKTTKPEMPSVEMELSPEKLVQITEVFVDKHYPAGQRARQLVAAEKILKRGITEEKYIEAYTDMQEWWNDTRGLLHVVDMAANTKNKQMRTFEILDRIEERKELQRNRHPAKSDRVNAKNTNRATQSYTLEDYAEIGEVEQRQMDEFYAAHPELRVGA